MKKLILILIILLCPVISSADEVVTKGDLYWLTQNVYHEARGESLFGQLVVAFVTLERFNSHKWGDKIKDVVLASGQFSWTNDGKSDIPKDKKAWVIAKDVATLSIMLYPFIDSHFNVMFYHNTGVSPYWSDTMKKVGIIGNHIFYEEGI